MNKQKLSNRLADQASKLASWRLMAAAMLIGNLLLIVFMFQLKTAEKTIVTPPNFDRPFWVQGNEVSPEYIEQMTEYFSQQVLTYTKKNALYRFENVLHFVTPSAYAAMDAKLKTEARRIERNDISSVFYPMGISIDRMTAVIQGEVVGMIGTRVVSRKTKYFRWEYAYRSGQFSILSFKEVAKDAAGAITEIEREEQAEMVAPVPVEQPADMYEEGVEP